MTARLLDGKALAADLRAEAAAEAAAFCAEAGHAPGLGVILAGDDPASRSYVTAKEKACAEAGIASREVLLPADASRAQLLNAVAELNAADGIDGILVQLPLPDPSMEDEVIAALAKMDLPARQKDALYYELYKGTTKYSKKQW